MTTRLALAVFLAFVSLSSVAAVAPAPPQNLGALVARDAVHLTWQAPTTGDVPTAYVVDASLSPGGAVIASLRVADTAMTVTNVPNGVYYVRVRAVNVDGSSSASNEVIVSVPSGPSGCAAPPNAPTNFTASASGNAVTLVWAAPVGGCPAVGYIVQAGSALGLSDIAVVNVGPATTFPATAPAGTYYIRVAAFNAFGGKATSDTILTVRAGEGRESERE